MKTYLHLSFAALVLFTANAFASDKVALYKEKFIQAFPTLFGTQLTPILEKKGLPRDQIDESLKSMALLMADCQVQLLSHYDQRYSDMVYSFVQSGGGITEASKKVDEQMGQDLENGTISEEALTEQINKAISTYQSCTNKIFSSAL